MTTEMYSKITTFVLVAAIAAVLITSATLAMTDDADAKKRRRGAAETVRVLPKVIIAHLPSVRMPALRFRVTVTP